MKKKIFFLAFFCVFACCLAGNAVHAMSVHAQDERSEHLEWRGEAFKRIVLQELKRFWGFSQESVKRIYKSGIYLRELRQIYERDPSPSGFQKNVEIWSKAGLSFFCYDRDYGCAYVESLANKRLHEIEETLQSFAAARRREEKREEVKRDKVEGVIPGEVLKEQDPYDHVYNQVCMQSALSQGQELTEAIYRKACIEAIKLLGVSTEDAEKEYENDRYNNPFWMKENFLDIYKADPQGFVHYLRDLYEYRTKMLGGKMSNPLRIFHLGTKKDSEFLGSCPNITCDPALP